MLSIYNISYHNIDIRPQLVSESVFDFKFEPVAYCIVKVHRIRNVEVFFIIILVVSLLHTQLSNVNKIVIMY